MAELIQLPVVDLHGVIAGEAIRLFTFFLREVVVPHEDVCTESRERGPEQTDDWKHGSPFHSIGETTDLTFGGLIKSIRPLLSTGTIPLC